MASPAERVDGEVMIEVDHLVHYYGPFPALRDVSFRAARGEIVGFLGPNGAGKTTAMRIITGYLPPTDGQARVAGHDVLTDSMAARRAIGYLPETTPLYTEMTVESYLSFMARLRGVDDIEPAIERAMDRVDLLDRRGDLIAHLSKGYRQRVGIAQAIVHSPPVIILDEPTIGLDPRQIREVRHLIAELRGEHTIILSTHILPEAQQVCDRVLIMHRGQIAAEDTPDELTARLAGGERVRVGVPADLDAETVSAALGAVEGVSEVEVEGGGHYLVAAHEGANPRPDLAETIVGRGWPLLQLTPFTMSLEDIFLELTAEESEVEPATGEPAGAVPALETEEPAVATTEVEMSDDAHEHDDTHEEAHDG